IHYPYGRIRQKCLRRFTSNSLIPERREDLLYQTTNRIFFLHCELVCTKSLEATLSFSGKTTNRPSFLKERMTWKQPLTTLSSSGRCKQ
ncbi:hypothetical protein PFISCL1PPCAC_1596, partial [Pristionchus fissidentatus]